MEIVFGVYVLVAEVDGRELANLDCRYDPRYVREHFYHAFESLVNRSVMRHHHFFERVRIELEKALQS